MYYCTVFQFGTISLHSDGCLSKHFLNTDLYRYLTAQIYIDTSQLFSFNRWKCTKCKQINEHLKYLSSFTSYCKCWITRVNASNFLLLLARHFFSCWIIPLWCSHFLLYCVNSCVFFSVECSSVELWVCMHEFLGLLCFPLSTAKTRQKCYFCCMNSEDTNK